MLSSPEQKHFSLAPSCFHIQHICNDICLVGMKLSLRQFELFVYENAVYIIKKLQGCSQCWMKKYIQQSENTKQIEAEYKYRYTVRWPVADIARYNIYMTISLTNTRFCISVEKLLSCSNTDSFNSDYGRMNLCVESYRRPGFDLLRSCGSFSHRNDYVYINEGKSEYILQEISEAVIKFDLMLSYKEQQVLILTRLYQNVLRTKHVSSRYGSIWYYTKYQSFVFFHIAVSLLFHRVCRYWIWNLLYADRVSISVPF